MPCTCHAYTVDIPGSTDQVAAQTNRFRLSPYVTVLPLARPPPFYPFPFVLSLIHKFVHSLFPSICLLLNP